MDHVGHHDARVTWAPELSKISSISESSGTHDAWGPPSSMNHICTHEEVSGPDAAAAIKHVNPSMLIVRVKAKD